MNKNRLIIATAGSGKTTTLVSEALSLGRKDRNILITTFTEANKRQIENKIIKETGGFIPKNVTVQTWFSFLLQHGVRPYKSVMGDDLWGKKIGFYLTSDKSGKKYNQKGEPIKIKDFKTGKDRYIYWGEDEDFIKHYFTNDYKMYSDKISKFIINCNKKTKEKRNDIGLIIDRISRVFQCIFIDEIQDMVGYDLDILQLLFKSDSDILLVGDPRQVTYSTHPTTKNPSYQCGKIDEFIKDKCKEGLCDIDFELLKKSHRNNDFICNYSSKLFPEYSPSEPCDCEKCRNSKVDGEGIFLIKENDVSEYCKKYSPTILRWEKAMPPEWNFGLSKGLEFDRVLIYPTKPITDWIKDNNCNLPTLSRCRFYVALTRAKYSVGIVFDYCNEEEYDGLIKWTPN
ncbi:MAG: UvrD-helicase domain-containing protein [Candidatus Moranbacteria bacterium]|nr:UvrD-helicase domain-containing protein [Candidatus Moranbacteria bacterium]